MYLYMVDVGSSSKVFLHGRRWIFMKRDIHSPRGTFPKYTLSCYVLIQRLLFKCNNPNRHFITNEPNQEKAWRRALGAHKTHRSPGSRGQGCGRGNPPSGRVDGQETVHPAARVQRPKARPRNWLPGRGNGFPIPVRRPSPTSDFDLFLDVSFSSFGHALHATPVPNLSCHSSIGSNELVPFVNS